MKKRVIEKFVNGGVLGLMRDNDTVADFSCRAICKRRPGGAKIKSWYIGRSCFLCTFDVSILSTGTTVRAMTNASSVTWQIQCSAYVCFYFDIFSVLDGFVLSAQVSSVLKP